MAWSISLLTCVVVWFEGLCCVMVICCCHGVAVILALLISLLWGGGGGEYSLQTELVSARSCTGRYDLAR